MKFEKLQKGSGKNVTKLEMFFSGFPKIIGMEYFPNLQSLTLMGQQIVVLENLDCLPNLTELCVSESKLTVSGIQISTKCKIKVSLARAQKLNLVYNLILYVLLFFLLFIQVSTYM